MAVNFSESAELYFTSIGRSDELTPEWWMSRTPKEITTIVRKLEHDLDMLELDSEIAEQNIEMLEPFRTGRELTDIETEELRLRELLQIALEMLANKVEA